MAGLGRIAAAAAAVAMAAARPARARNYNTTSKRQEGRINVHLVPHTHDDVGWLKTLDQYYYGLRNDIQRATVQNILNSVTKELAWNPDRKFIYVEQAFFQMFWAETSDAMRAMVKDLVARGQLEFVNGGWSMHDEANPSFVDMVDQTTLGHRWLLQEFNVTPTVTWQIDPFGHSSFQGAVMSSPMAGYTGVYFMRDDWQDIAARNASRTSEMIWSPSASLGTAGTTYAGILYGGYCTVPGISMDFWSLDDPVMDDPDQWEPWNIESVIDLVMQSVDADIIGYPQGGPDGGLGPDGTADVMFPLGCDFEYENAATWYTNTDKLIHYLNLDGRVNAFYSSPSIYTAAKLAAGNSYTLKTDDFMPYGFFPHGYLTGFYTSRPGLKGYVRDTSSLFQAAKQIQTLSGGAVDTGSDNPLYRIERALGVAQHHDAISGTAKQNVTYDYARRLAAGREDTDAMLSASFGALTGYNSQAFVGCDLSNATICPALEAGQPTAVMVWNQHAQDAATINVMLPVGFPSGVRTYSVTDCRGQAVVAQVLPLSAADRSLRTQYYNYSSSVEMGWLAFQAKAVPAAGYCVHFLVPSSSDESCPYTHRSTVTDSRAVDATSSAAATMQITNGIISLQFDTTTALLTQYSNAATSLSMPLQQQLLWYNSSTGGPHPCPGIDCEQNSGAYIFRPWQNEIHDLPTDGNGTSITMIGGPVVNMTVQAFNSWASQNTMLWAGQATSFDIEWTVGPIPFHDGWGKEVVSRITTSMATNATWWTDSNGRDSVKRIRFYRPTWNLTVDEPIAGEYYPVPSFIYTQDIITGAVLSVNTDRAEGGSSALDGSLELMVHRRLLADDKLGVGEPLNETGLNIHGIGLVARGVQRVSVQPDAASAGVARRTAVAELMYRPVLRFAPVAAGTSPSTWLQEYKGQYTGLAQPLPPNVHLLTAHSWGPQTLLLRLSHSYETGEGGNMSTPVTVGLASIFNGFNLTACTETTITGNQPLAAVPKTTYNVTGGPVVTLPVVPAPPSGQAMSITLDPLQIRTFMCSTTPQDAVHEPYRREW